MASYLFPFVLTRRRSAVLRAVAATVFVVGAAGTCACLLSGCGMSEAHAQSVSQSPSVVVTSPPISIAVPHDNSETQSLLHQANTSYHAHDWLGALIDYQQIYYSDSEHGHPDDQGLGSFAQARMSLCHTWTGVNALQQGDYATSDDEFTAALDDNSGNATAKRLLDRSNQQYRLLTAVEDVRQPMSDVDDAPDEQSAIDSIQASSAKSCAVLAGLTDGTATQKKAAFHFLEAYNDAFATNYLLSHHVDVEAGVYRNANQSAPTDSEVVYDRDEMASNLPRMNEVGQAVFGRDDLAEVEEYEPVLANERVELENDEMIAQDPGEQENLLLTEAYLGRDDMLRERQEYLHSMHQMSNSSQ